jgi:ribosomal protein S18 acetylase RimI-like enzyme
MSLTALQEMGALVDGFAEEGATDLTYSAAYYPDLLASAGLRRVFPMVTLRLDDVRRLDVETLLDKAQRARLDSGTVRLRQADLARAEKEMDVIRDLLNEAFRGAPYTRPISREEYRFLILPTLGWLDPELVLIAEMEGVPVGCIIGLPDLYPAQRAAHGRGGLLNAWRTQRALADKRGAVVTLGATLPQAQGVGVGHIMLAELVRALQRRGYRRLSVTWAAEENQRSLGATAVLGARVAHRLAIFERDLADVT